LIGVVCVCVCATTVLTSNLFDNLFVQGSYLQVAFWLAALHGATPAPTDTPVVTVSRELIVK